MTIIDKFSISGFNKMEVPYMLLRSGVPSRKLAIMLPGAGYTTQAPLFHYTTEMFLNWKWDVLEVNYRYNDKAYDEFTTDDLAEIIRHDVKAVIDKILSKHPYETFAVIGKSLGTLAMCSERHREVFQNAPMVWLTPLIHRDDVLEAMTQAKQPGIAFIGDQDPFYSDERYRLLKDNSLLLSSLVPGVGHGFDHAGDVQKSIDALKKVLEGIEAFAIEERA